MGHAKAFETFFGCIPEDRPRGAADGGVRGSRARQDDLASPVRSGHPEARQAHPAAVLRLPVPRWLSPGNALGD